MPSRTPAPGPEGSTGPAKAHRTERSTRGPARDPLGELLVELLADAERTALVAGRAGERGDAGRAGEASAPDTVADAAADAHVRSDEPTDDGAERAPRNERAGDGVATALAAAGFDVVQIRALRLAPGDSAGPRAPAPHGGYGAVVLRTDRPPSPRELDAAHGLLARTGRLAVLIRPAGATAISAVTRSLYEERFAVLDTRHVDRDPRAPLGVVVARRAEHRVRGYRPGDEAAILELFRRSFHRERPLAHWRWKYLGCPYGALRISVAEGPAGELVAHYAGYPLHLHDATRSGACGLEATAHHVGDTMTAPEARRVGRGRTSLLARTMRHFFAAYCDGRVGLNYGFNAGRIHRYYRRSVNEDRHAPVTHRVRELPPGGAAIPPARGRWRVERAERVDRRFDELFRRVRDAYGLLVVRDAAYLGWRYLARPDVRYELWTVRRGRRLAGWGVFRREEGPEGARLVWGDALFDPERPDAVGALLGRVAAAPGAAAAGWIEGWFPPRPSWWDRALRELGFVERPEPQEIGLVYLPFLRDPGEDLGARLYYTKGDGDLF